MQVSLLDDLDAAKEGVDMLLKGARVTMRQVTFQVYCQS